MNHPTTIARITGALLLASSVLSGCATPQPVLDLANRGAGVVSMGEAELQRYLDAAHDHLAVRLLIVRQLSAAEIDEKFRDVIEDPDRQQGDMIRRLGEERKRKREARDAELARLDERHR